MGRKCAFLIFLLQFALPTQAAVQMYYLHNDHLGTPRVVTKQDQSVVWEGQLKPFGEMKVEVETITNHRRFPGQRFDIESRLYYNYFRDYDPTTGRYIQSDPIGLNGGINTYAYVEGNPLKYTDPLGLCGPLTPFCAFAYANAVAINAAGIGLAEVGAGVTIASGAAFAGRAAQPAIYNVYYGLKNGVPVYVGITKNLAQRSKQWDGTYDSLQQINSCPIPKDQARGIEQYLINQNPNFNNLINSISPNRPWYQQAVDYGQSYMQGLGQ